MKVNINKTAMITISDAKTFKSVAYIEDEEGQRIVGDKERLKIVGFFFDRSPTVSLHVKETIKKLRRRYWVIRHLKRHGLNEEELVRVYKSNLRSVVEYCSVVYGPMLTQEQEDAIERAQGQALKIIFGFNNSYRKVLEMSGLETLKERRLSAMKKFALTCKSNKYISIGSQKMKMLGHLERSGDSERTMLGVIGS